MANNTKSHPVLGLIFLVLVIAVIVHAVSGASSKTSSTGSAGTRGAGNGIGQVAKDGDFAFVVQSFDCSAGAATAATVTTLPGTKECFATLKVTDDKSEAQTYFSSNQYAYDAVGRKFSADDAVTFNLADANDMTQLNPGISITAVVPFQVPSRDSITKLQLHDSAFSGGVIVNLSH